MIKKTTINGMDIISTTYTNSLNLRMKISLSRYRPIYTATIFEIIKIKRNHHFLFITLIFRYAI